MTTLRQPLKSFNTLLLAGVMASATLAATAQTVDPAVPAVAAAPGKPADRHGEHMGRHDPARMQARMAQHQAELKAKLNLSPAQEGAWTTFTASMQPLTHHARMTQVQQAEMNKLTTPDRIDKMRALRSQHMAEMNASMDKRGDASKTFYAALNADQKKVFDSQRMGRGMGDKGGTGHGGGHGAQHKG